MSGTATQRRAYAAALAPEGRIRAAFAAVPREAFLGPPPWQIVTLDGGISSTTREPADLYADVLVVLDAERGANNGSPALHAHMLALLDVAEGARVLHLGAGTGYYTALLAELVGSAGQVMAVEVDPALAAAARANLGPWPQARVMAGDAADYPEAEVARIYVNFALAQPAPRWLERLAMGGVLLFPLGAPDPRAPPPQRRYTARAALLRVERTASGYAAAFDWPVSFIFAEGPAAGDAAWQAALWTAFGRGGLERVRSLHRGPLPRGRRWAGSARFSLGFDPP